MFLFFCIYKKNIFIFSLSSTYIEKKTKKEKNQKNQKKSSYEEILTFDSYIKMGNETPKRPDR